MRVLHVYLVRILTVLFLLFSATLVLFQHIIDEDADASITIRRGERLDKSKSVRQSTVKNFAANTTTDNMDALMMEKNRLLEELKLTESKILALQNQLLSTSPNSYYEYLSQLMNSDARRPTQDTNQLNSDMNSRWRNDVLSQLSLPDSVSQVKNNIQPESHIRSETGSKGEELKIISEVGSENFFERENSLREVYYEEFFSSKLQAAEISSGIRLSNEYELIPFTRFTLSRVYPVDPGLGKRVVEKPIGYRKKDILEVVEFAIARLNKGRNIRPDFRFTSDNFLEGIYRTVPGIGTQYELYFRDPESAQYRKILVARLFGPPMIVSKQTVTIRKEFVNLIVPLSGRLDSFRQFMDRFVDVCIRLDGRVFLTVVHFGSPQEFLEVDWLVKQTSTLHRYSHVKVVVGSGNFSRGKALDVGARSWTSPGDVLMFFCDVDVVFSADFLERCRLNAEVGRRVYYPIVFSLYNPRTLRTLQSIQTPPQREHQSSKSNADSTTTTTSTAADVLVISKDSGFWRDFGYGMTCQYRSDFIEIGGFDGRIQGWGLEDVYLYRKYVRSDLFVVRATDPGIFHPWHEKSCDPMLSPDQYLGCIRSKALNEASHDQLGLLAFKEEIDLHRNIMKSRN